MRTKDVLRLSGSMLLAVSLTACGGGGSNNSSSPAPTPPPVATTPTPASFQSQFGSAFAAIFNAATTSEPVDPTDASVPALAPASPPIDDGTA